MVTPSLKAYIEAEILPRYENFDAAHRLDHAQTVIRQSMEIAAHYPELKEDMVYAIAAYHDTGLVDGRETHHLGSGRIIRTDRELQRWFNQEEIETMAQAAEDHRASAKQAPRSLYGKVVAEADRFIDPETIIRRTVQYGLANYPELDREQQFERTLQHMREKYGDDGYLHLWFPESPNTARLEALRAIIRRPEELRRRFDRLYSRLS